MSIYKRSEQFIYDGHPMSSCIERELRYFAHCPLLPLLCIIGPFVYLWATDAECLSTNGVSNSYMMGIQCRHALRESSAILRTALFFLFCA
eukprot:c30751_g1_i1 orf=361-633(+)